MRAKLTSLLMILCLLMVFAAVVHAAPAGKVTNLDGRADLTGPGQPAKALFIGDAVNVGDILRTKSGAKLEVTWIDGSIARLSENSRLKVTEFNLGAQKRSTILSLFRGKVQNVVTGTTKLFGAKDGSKYEVHTPTSVCGVRGTTFFTYHENGISGALFTEGQGFMYSKGQPENVKPVAPGVIMVVTSANKPPEAKPAKPGDATKLFNATNPSEKKKDDKKGEDKKEGGTGGGTSGTGGTTSTSGKDESTGGTKKEDTGSTAGTTGTTGTGDTASGTAGTGGTTAMLGGDPTATLGTAAPGTLAAKIETGTVADSPGTSSPLTNPTTPVTPVVPVIETQTTTTFTQDVTQGTIAGTLTGSIGDTTNTGTINLAGTGMESIYVVPTTGTLSDGSTDNSYLAGIPGSWRGLFTGLSRKGTSVSLLSGDLSGAYAADQALSASGSISRATGYGISAESQYQSFTDLPLLVLQNVSIGQAFSDPVIYGPASGDITTDGIMGYNTSTGGILGIWGAQTLNGAYINATGETGKTVKLYHYNYYPEYQDPSDHFAFGSATITDDLQGHTTVKSSALTYLDRYYLGTLSLDYRGVYVLPQDAQLQTGVSYPYSSIGTGVYNLQALSWTGDWGQYQGWWYYGPASLYQNTYYPEDGYSSMEFVGHDIGLAGGVAPFWTGTSRLTALGYIVDDYDTPVSGETVAGSLLWNTGIGAQALTGSTVDDVFIPDAEFTGVTAGIWKDGLMKGSAYAIYKTAAGQAGWLIGKDTVSGLYDSEIGMWKAEGDLTPTQKIAQLPAGITSADLEVFHDIAMGIAGGSFTGNQGIIYNYNNIMQTTFFGKLVSVYDEEYQEYVEKILPLRWGIYDLRMAYGNSFSGKPSGATSWTSKIGGYGPTQMNAPFFYLADITGTWAADETISGQLAGTYMTPLYLGVLSGPFYGLYTEGEISGSGGWIGQSIGTYNVTQKLAHSATWGENLYVWYSGEGGLFTDAGGELDHTGYVMGLLGGTTAPWSGSSAFKAMGLFQLPVELGMERGTYLWSDAIQGSVPRDITDPVSAGGIYTGYSAALWRTNSYTGSIRTIYLTPPDATTAKSTAGFLAGDNTGGSIYNLVRDTQEYSEYTETYTIGAWESTGTNTLTASTPLASGLDPQAVTLAGGSMDAKLSGTFGGAGVLTNDTAWGDFTFFMNGATPLPFGVYDLKLGSGDPGGTFSGKPTGSTAWTAKTGGTFNYEAAYEYGYWLADVGGQWNTAGEITGNVSNGTYITPTQMGTLSGPFYGLYTEQGSDETGVFGTWVGQSIGSYVGSDLKFVSDIYPSLRYYNGSDWQYDSMSVYGLLGGKDSLWTSTASAPVALSTLGTVYGTANNASHIFNTVTYSHNYKDSTVTTYDGGSYYLLYGGRELNSQMDADIVGLYIKDSKAGFLIGSIAGSIYQDIGMWNAEGTIYKEEKIATNIPAESLNSNIWYGSLSGNMSAYSNSLSGSIGYSAVRTLYDNAGTTWMNGGIWSFDLGGSHSGTIAAPWTAIVGGEGIFGPYYNGAFIVDSGYWLADVSNGTWDGNKLGADISGTYLTRHQMGTMNGNLLGTYNNTTWQAAGIGTYDNGQLLAFSGSVDWGSCGYFDTNPSSPTYNTMVYGDPSGTYLKGIIGSATSFIGASAPLSGIGTYYAASVYPLYEINISKNLNAAFKADSLNLWFGGVKNSTSLSGRMMGLYANFNGTNYDVGYLSTGDVTGNFYSGIGMWELTSGALTSSSKGTLDTVSDITPNITVTNTPRIGSIAGNGGIKGVSNGYDMYFTQADGTWGVWRAETGGTYTSDPTSGWTGVDGTVEMVNNVIQSYSISHLTGTDWADGQLAATASGRFLSLEGTGRSSGDILGVYDSSSKTWQALGIGQIEQTETLAFSSLLTGNLYQVVPGTVYNKEYKQPHWNSSGSSSWFNPLRYEINYFVPADITTYPYDVRRTIAFESYRTINDGNIEYHYFPNGKYVPVMKGMGITFETESVATSDTTNFASNPPVTPLSGSVDIVDNTPGTTSTLTDAQHVKSFYSEWLAANALVQNGAFTGILGGLKNVSLWNSSSENKTNLILMGNHNAYNGSQLFATSMYGSIGTGGYLGVLSGIIQDTDATTAYSENPLEGMIVGLYVDPNGNAGVLKGNFTGASYTGSVNMWESTDAQGAATLYRYSTNASGLSPYALASYFQGNIGAGINSAVHGTFGGSGSIDTPMGIMGQTFSIGSTPCWGIFHMQIGLANTYSKPAGSSNTWTASLLGSGEFGKYPTVSSGTYRDLGYWNANITSGTWTGGELTGILAGDFLTHKKIGTLEGTLLGTYDGTTSGIWQAAATGSYTRTDDVLFSSEIWGDRYQLVTAKTGSKSDYGDESSYHYWYNNDATSSNNYGDSTYYNKTANTRTITRFDIQGPPGAEKAHKDVWVQGAGSDATWDTADDTYTFTTIVYDTLEAYNADMAKLQNDPVSQNPITSTDQMNFRDSDFNGILAGVDNLWANMGTVTPTVESPYTSSPTKIYLMGDINKFDGPSSNLFTGAVASFNPLVSLYPFNNSMTPVVDGKYGAYYGFLGGTAAPDNTLSGFFRAFYMDKDRNVGLIYTDAAMAGSFDSATGMWKADGNVYTYQLLNASHITDSSVMPESFASKLQSGWGQGWDNNMSFDPVWEDGHVSGGTGINFATSRETGVGFPFSVEGKTSYMSLGTGAIGGTYSGNNLPTSWTWTFSQQMNEQTTFIKVMDLTITESNQTFNGKVVNTEMSPVYASTMITGGEIKGLFDPVAHTWQAVRNGTSVETAAFLAKIASKSGDAAALEAFMNATKIPAIHIGSTDLRGNGSVTGGTINLGSAADAGKGILNTAFFAYSTGAPPQVWASGSVNGAYTGSPTAGTVNLSGYAPGTTGTTNGITANFNVQQFGASTWSATVTNGNAPANSLTAPQGGSATHAAMTFQGGAAGSVTPSPSAGGTFTGTAAGIVK